MNTATQAPPVSRSFQVRLRRTGLILIAWLALLGGLFAARARWGLDGPTDHWQLLDHPFRIHVANRSETPVLVDAIDENQQRRSVFVLGRRREWLDVSAPIGSRVAVTTREIAIDGPGARSAVIDWAGLPGHDLRATLQPSESIVRALEPARLDDRSFFQVRSQHDLPILVDWDPQRPYSEGWTGTGVTRSSFGGIGVLPGTTVSLTYTIPAVGRTRQLDVEVNADGELEVSIGRDGVVEAHELSLGPRLLKALHF